MMGSSGSLARQSPLRLCPKAVYAMRSTMLPCPVDYQYDINGNIINKSDVGDYSYNAASGVRPHTPNLINLAKVLGGDGGVVTTSCLYFLVTASIRTVGEEIKLQQH
jgi:hypothetical protein